MPRAVQSKFEIAPKIVEWFQRNARDLPWRRTRDPYAIWISEVMLQQTQVKTVIPFWVRWMELFPTVNALASATEEQVLKAWEGFGYYSRARNLQKAARMVCESKNGEFPRAFEEVLALPGVGRYTAGAICSIAYGEAAPILDGNVIRVLSRVFAIEGDPKRKENLVTLWQRSTDLVAEAARSGACSDLNQGLMELGATVCLPREPQCAKCPIDSECAAHRAGREHELPQMAKREKPRQRRFLALVLRHGSRFLARQRAEALVNGKLWEFPNYEVKRGVKPITIAGVKLKDFAVIKHTITTNRITLRAKCAVVNGEAEALARDLGGRWLTLAQLEQLPFSSAHGRLRALLRANSQS